MARLCPSASAPAGLGGRPPARWAGPPLWPCWAPAVCVPALPRAVAAVFEPRPGRSGPASGPAGPPAPPASGLRGRPPLPRPAGRPCLARPFGWSGPPLAGSPAPGGGPPLVGLWLCASACSCRAGPLGPRLRSLRSLGAARPRFWGLRPTGAGAATPDAAPVTGHSWHRQP